MLNNPLSLDIAIKLLNELNTLDSEFTAELVGARFPCNDAIDNHPRFQVQVRKGEPAVAGFLGILNGLFGTIPEGPRKGWGPIMAVIDEDGKIIKFAKSEEIR